MKLDFIYIGGPRSANTWMGRCLNDHPDIFVPKKQEISPFDEDGNILYDDLKRAFLNSKSNELRGVFPVLFMSNHRNFEYLKKNYPDIKIIACLRNPVERAYSGYFHNVTRRKYEKNISFKDALERYQELTEPGFFYKHLKIYYDNFPRKNIFVMIYEDIKKDPELFIKKIYNFLEVDSNFVSHKIFSRPNPSTNRRVYLKSIQAVVIKILKIGRIIRKNNLGGKIISLMKGVGSEKLINLINRKNLIPDEKRKPTIRPEMSREINEYLCNLYKTDIESLEVLINRNLEHWK